MIRRAIATRPCQSAGMPFPSMHSPTTAAPYFLHSGRIESRTSLFPLTELTMALPLYTRRPASMTAGSVVNSERNCRPKATSSPPSSAPMPKA